MAIQKKKPTLGISIVAAVVAAVYWWHQRPMDRAASLTPRISAAHLIISWNETRDRENESSVGAISKGKSAPVNYKKSFAESHSYWDYAHKILPAAKAGDADAQFYLSRLLERCNDDNRMYFQHKGVTLTLNEGLQYAVQRRLPIEVAQAVYDRCHEFQDHDLTELGSASDWLAKATDAGEPLAQTTTAYKILMQNLQQNFSNAGGVPNSGTDAPVGGGADPRELLRAAVESKDPEVLFNIGEFQELLDPSNYNDNKTTRFAWWLVACQRGFDCSANAEWVKNSCVNDPQCASASSPSDLVRSLSGDNWFNVQQRAQEIDANLDASQWAALGLGG
jgi:hypothetical protein